MVVSNFTKQKLWPTFPKMILGHPRVVLQSFRPTGYSVKQLWQSTYGLISWHTSSINCVNNCTFIFTRHQPRLFLKALLVYIDQFVGVKHNVCEERLNMVFKLQLVYLPKGKYCVYPRMVYRLAIVMPHPPFWMSENEFRSHFSPFQINTQLLFFFDFVHKMAAGGHFG